MTIFEAMAASRPMGNGRLRQAAVWTGPREAVTVTHDAKTGIIIPNVRRYNRKKDYARVDYVRDVTLLPDLPLCGWTANEPA